MMMVSLFVPMAAMLTLVAIVGLVTRLVATAFLNRTIREALKSDPGSVPLLADRLDRHPPWGDALLGWIFLALAAGLLLVGLTGDDWDSRETVRAAAVPAIVGLVVLAHSWFAARRAPRA